MVQEDVPAVLHVQSECYQAATIENEATVRARLDIAPNSAWVAENSAGVCAYLVGYPSILGKVTRLGGLFDIPDVPDCLYLHDLAVSRRANGWGLGPALVRLAWERALERGLQFSSLVSVQGSRLFWERLGYEAWEDLNLCEAAKLKTYAGQSWYMARKLG